MSFFVSSPTGHPKILADHPLDGLLFWCLGASHPRRRGLFLRFASESVARSARVRLRVPPNSFRRRSRIVVALQRIVAPQVRIVPVNVPVNVLIKLYKLILVSYFA